MFLEITDGNPPTSLPAIEEFEQSHGLSLPGSYKEFLLQANGGRPLTATFPIKGLALNPFGKVHFFFGIGAQLPVYDLVKTFDWFRHRIPAGIVPIACTAGSDYICLDLREEQGKVVYWDNRPFWGTGIWREQDLYHVADSFDEFITVMRSGPHGPA